MSVSAEYLHYTASQISSDCFPIFPVAPKLIWHVTFTIRLKQVTCDWMAEQKDGARASDKKINIDCTCMSDRLCPLGGAQLLLLQLVNWVEWSWKKVLFFFICILHLAFNTMHLFSVSSGFCSPRKAKRGHLFTVTEEIKAVRHSVCTV